MWDESTQNWMLSIDNINDQVIKPSINLNVWRNCKCSRAKFSLLVHLPPPVTTQTCNPKTATPPASRESPTPPEPQSIKNKNRNKSNNNNNHHNHNHNHNYNHNNHDDNHNHNHDNHDDNDGDNDDDNNNNQ